MRALRRLTFAWTILLLLNSSARAQLVDNGDGTVTDLQTGLMWLRNANMAGTAMTHDAAKTWAESLVFAGHSDWRLPSGANPDGTVCNSRPTGANCTQTEFASLYFANTIRLGHADPFQNIQYNSYWTNTDLPGDPTRALAQDFLDGGQNDFPKTTPMWAWAVRSAGIPPGTPTLYGVILRDQNAGYLIRINPLTAAATLVGSTGLQQPCSLTYNDGGGVLFVNECLGTAGIHTVDPATGAASPLGSPAVANEIAYVYLNNSIYGVSNEIDFATMFRIDPGSGASLGIQGQLTVGPVSAMTARSSDGRLFGVAADNLLAERWLVTIATGASASPLETKVAQLTQSMTGIAFHPDGTLFATNGTILFKMHPQTGVTTAVGSFGPNIGFVSGLAIVAPAPIREPDVWIRDCVGDTGMEPSAPTPCAEWTNSPDIAVANVFGPYLLPGFSNRVRATVRNRGTFPANGTLVDFHYGVPGSAPSIGTATRIGQRTVNLPPGASRNVEISFTPPASAARNGWCLGVVLNHTADPPIQPFVQPPYDNNLAVRCSTGIRVGSASTLRYPFNFGSGSGWFGFRQWRDEFSFRAQSQLPAGWEWSVTGVDLDKPMRVPPGSDRRGEIVIRVPADATPRSAGTVKLTQVDRVGRTLGSLEIALVEDNNPPEAPTNVRARRRPDGRVEVSWRPVHREAQTGFDESIAYYEVFRDGKLVATVLDDEDRAPDIQWTDSATAGRRGRYSVRAVDAGGKASTNSPMISVVEGGGR